MALSSKAYAPIPIIGVYVGMGVILLVTQPYKGSRNNYRPFANYLITILVAAIFVGIGFSGESEGFLAMYGPLVIIVLLLVCIVYSVYALVQDIRECSRSGVEQKDKIGIETEMDSYTNKMAIR